MPRQVDVEKLKGTIHLPLGETLEREIRTIGKCNGVSAQTLFRWAAEALIQAQREFGRIPRDMRIVGAPWPPVIYSIPSSVDPSCNEPSSADLIQQAAEARRSSPQADPAAEKASRAARK